MLEELKNFFGRFESVLVVVKLVNVEVNLEINDISLVVVFFNIVFIV